MASAWDTRDGHSSKKLEAFVLSEWDDWSSGHDKICPMLSVRPRDVEHLVCESTVYTSRFCPRHKLCSPKESCRLCSCWYGLSNPGPIQKTSTMPGSSATSKPRQLATPSHSSVACSARLARQLIGCVELSCKDPPVSGRRFVAQTDDGMWSTWGGDREIVTAHGNRIAKPIRRRDGPVDFASQSRAVPSHS